MRRNGIACLGVLLGSFLIGQAAPLFEQTDVFVSGREGYFAYRIPAIETAPDGSLLAFAEGRKHSLHDPGFKKQHIDLVLKRSVDLGRTWSAMQIIENAGEGWSAANPCTVVDRNTQKIWLFYLRGKPGRNTYTARPGTDDVQILARHSSDNGRSWSEPTNLTSETRDMGDPKWRTSVPGPGGGIQSRDGRLAIPVWRFEPWSVFALVSEDSGATWKRGGFVPDASGDECQLVELADGRWLFDIRQHRGAHRFRATSDNGGRTWSKPERGEEVSRVCCAIERYTSKAAGDDRDRLLWTGPIGPERSNLVLQVSYDEGATFSHQRNLWTGPAAYSDLTVLKDKTAGVLWERGTNANYQFITFSRFHKEWLEDTRGAAEKGKLRVATFSADVTVPLGHGMMGGAWLSTRVADPLEAHGVALLGDGPPVVLVSVDWCEIRNDAYRAWQKGLAEAAGTMPERVLITAVHQHDAPVADLQAERILRSRKLKGTICDPDFHARSVDAVGKALRASLQNARPLTHIGTGQAKVERIASNRRYVSKNGSIRFDRTSSTSKAEAVAAEEGVIDPFLKTLSFWDGETALAAISFYAVHPMSYYGAGEVSADFPGLARRRRQAETGVHQIYCSGASGNVTAGKYNTGAKENRPALADRLHAAMVQAWAETKKHPVTKIAFRSVPLPLEPRDGGGFSTTELEAKLTPAHKPFEQCLAAMGLSWRKRVEARLPIEVPAIDFGPSQVLLLPGEAYVEFQLAAQAARPESFVCVAGYGEAACGYIPTEKHIAEGDTNLADWSWVAPGSEARLLEAIRAALKQP